MSTTQVANDGLSSQDLNCTILVTATRSDNVSMKDLKEAIEKGNVAARRHALECMIRMHLNGQPQNHMIMPVIKYITPMEDHLIKRLVLYFWEVVDKTDKDGKLLSEIILICNYLRNDLQHPNEYVRGLTLRFLCRVTDRDLVSPLVSSLDQNLKHRVAYVRRTAVLALHVIYRKFPDLLPHAPDLLEAFIRDETDVTARRNAFDMLAAFAPDRAASFLQDFLDSHELSGAGAVFLMSAVEFCQQAIRANPQNKARYVPLLFAILQSKHAAVRFQCATTLLNLSSSPTAIRQALFIFIDILKTHSDNSVRLIVVDKLDAMRVRFLPMLQRALLDVLSALQSGTVEVRQKIVLLAQELVTGQNVEAFVQAMRKEMLKVQNELTQGSSVATAGAGQSESGLTSGAMSSGMAASLSAIAAYKLLILRAINRAVVHFPRVANTILPVLLDYICEPESPLLNGRRGGAATPGPTGLSTSVATTNSNSNSSSAEVAALIKETLLVQPALRASTLARLIESFPLIQNAVVMRSVLWILGAYANEAGEVERVFAMLQAAMQPLPLTPPVVPTVDVDAAGAAAAVVNGNASTIKAITTVREDGTYVTSYTTVVNANQSHTPGMDQEDGTNATSGLRSAIVRGDYFCAAVLAGTLAKFVATLFQDRTTHNAAAEAERVALQANAEALVRELIRYGTDVNTPCMMDGDTQEHLQLCLALLSHPHRGFLQDFLLDSRRAMEAAGTRTKEALLHSSSNNNTTLSAINGGQVPLGGAGVKSSSSTTTETLTAIDSPIFFSQLTTAKEDAVCEPEASEEPESPSTTTTLTTVESGGAKTSNTLTKATEYLRKIEDVIPLSGFEDPIYCEASVTVNRFDVSVNWQLMNKTAATFQNVSIELASLGGMRLLERPQSYTLGPYAVIKVRTPLKSSATETGVVFGSLLYDSQDGTRHYYSALLDIHVDIMNYVKPAICTAAEFRDKWRAYDWENKINVNTDRYGLLPYVTHIARELNMYLLDVLPDVNSDNEEGEEEDHNVEGEGEAEDGALIDENKNGSGGANRPPVADKEDCEYISCNLYARTIFNEDALANISIERDARGNITGVIRIRSNTQSVAYGIGEKINMLDKNPADTATAKA